MYKFIIFTILTLTSQLSFSQELIGRYFGQKTFHVTINNEVLNDTVLQLIILPIFTPVSTTGNGNYFDNFPMGFAIFSKDLRPTDSQYVLEKQLIEFSVPDKYKILDDSPFYYNFFTLQVDGLTLPRKVNAPTFKCDKQETFSLVENDSTFNCKPSIDSATQQDLKNYFKSFNKNLNNDEEKICLDLLAQMHNILDQYRDFDESIQKIENRFSDTESVNPFCRISNERELYYLTLSPIEYLIIKTTSILKYHVLTSDNMEFNKDRMNKLATIWKIFLPHPSMKTQSFHQFGFLKDEGGYAPNKLKTTKKACEEFKSALVQTRDFYQSKKLESALNFVLDDGLSFCEKK